MRRLRRAAVIGMLDALLLVDAGAEAGSKPPRTGPVNLLRDGTAVLAVSTTKSKSKGLPENLLDGDVDTVWASQIGDTKGAWIAFRTVGEVESIELTVGDTYNSSIRFLSRLRVRKVRVTHGGKRVGVYVLDPSSDQLQRISVSSKKRTGDWKVEVLEVISGTDEEANQVVISEFVVWGRMYNKPMWGGWAKTRVGSLDEPKAP